MGNKISKKGIELRSYCNGRLSEYGISEDEFVQTVDRVRQAALVTAVNRLTVGVDNK